MFVIYLDNISVLFIMSKGRDKPSVIDFWNIEHSHASGSEKYSTALVYFTVIGVIVNTALCYCILNVGLQYNF